MIMRITSGQRSFTSVRNSTPLRSGMRWSHRITCTQWSASSFSASRVEEAVSTSKSSSRMRRSDSRLRISSSTTMGARWAGGSDHHHSP
jgi:hypothetical protein